jgi:hypothetical protein
VIRAGLRLSAALLLAAGCARIEAPPGGPPDEIPPRILRVEPAAGSLNQPPDLRIDIVFDEYVDRASTEADIVFTPRPPGALKTSWAGRRLRIRFEEPLPPDRSWLLELGTGCRDLAGNRLPAPLRLPFATGPVLDSLELAGRVHDLEQGRWAEIWAWPAEDWPARTWADPPRRTRPDLEGRFRMLGLDTRPWRLLAVSDDDRDGRWRPFAEAAGLASWDGQPGSGIELGLRLGRELFLDSLVLRRARFLDPWTLALDGRLEPSILAGLDGAGRASPAGDSLRLTVLALETATGYPLRLAGLEPAEGGWRLALGEAADSLEYRLLLHSAPDTLRIPPPASLRPGPLLDPAPILEPGEPGPVLAVLRALSALQGEARQLVEGDTLPLPARRLSPFRVGFEPTRPGGRAQLPAGWLRFVGDAAWPDSLVELALPRPAAPAPTGALEWRVDRLPADTRWRLLLQAAQGLEFQAPLEAGGRLDGLPEGPLRLVLYQDRNRNQRWDPGSLSPWQPAEAWLPLPDSLEVIAGWTVGGLELRLPSEIP